jgi:single-strand DNA-binding protein
MKPGEISTVVVGNLPRDPELRFTQNGDPVVSFSIGVTPRSFDKTANEWKDGETSWVRCVAWRKLAENIAASLQKGHRVIVAGRFAERRYEDKEGNKRSAWELTVDACGPDLTFVEATVKKVDRVHQSPPEGDPWTTETPPAQAEEAPF